jgi:hypothetical protein
MMRHSGSFVILLVALVLPVLAGAEQPDRAEQIVTQLARQTNFWVAVVGGFAVIAGSVLTLAGQFLHDWLKSRPQRRLDEHRQEMLKKMLEDERFPNRWRRLTTLARVVGASEETTKKLLIEVGARGSEKDDSLWGLVRHHPFRETDQ